MAYAKYYNTPGMTAPRVLGEIDVRDGARFEFSERPAHDRANAWPDYPLRVFTCDGDRAARIGRTVAYVIIDETPDGSPVVERWALKNRRDYAI
jgi:hypothetical protein